MGQTSKLKLPFPDDTAPNDVPSDIKKLAEAVAEYLLAMDPRAEGNPAYKVFAGGAPDYKRYFSVPSWAVLGSDAPLTETQSNGTPAVRLKRFTDKTRPNGSADPLHYVSGGGNILLCQAWVRGNSAEAVPLPISSVDGDRVHIPTNTFGDRFFFGAVLYTDTLGYPG